MSGPLRCLILSGACRALKRYKSFAYFALGSVIGSVLLWALSGNNPEYVSAYMLVGLTGFLLGIPLSKIVSGESPWYGPHAITLLAFFMMYVAAPAVAMWLGPWSDYYTRNLTGSELNFMMLVAFTGILFYILGNRLGPKNPKVPRGIEWYFTDTPAVQSLFPIMTGLVFGVGLAAWAYAYAVTGGVGAHLTDLGGNRPELNAAAGGITLHLRKFVWIGAALWMSRYGLRISTFIIVGLAAIPLLLYGSRSFIAILFVGCFIVWRFRWTPKVPKIVWAGMAAGLIVLMSGYVLLRQTEGNVTEAAASYKSMISSTEGKVAALTGAFTYVGPMSEMLQEVGDKVPYQYGRTFGALLFVIPTALWPQQTEVFTGMGRLYTESLFPHRAGKITITPSIMTEYYVNFGWLGIIACSFFQGWLTKWFEGVLIGNPHRKYQVAWIAFAAVFSVNLLRVMKDSVGTLAFARYFALPVIIVYWPNIGLLFSPPPEPTGFDDDEAGDEAYE